MLCADYDESMTFQGARGTVVQVQMQPSGCRFDAFSDRTLLQAAFDAGITLPNACRNGTCRACLRPLHAGHVQYRIEWPGLLPEERTGGWVLPCVAYPLGDLVLGD